MLPPEHEHRTNRNALYQGMRPEVISTGITTMGARSVSASDRGVKLHERQLRTMCEEIGLKASQKFRTVREAFRHVDSDKDGSISRSEMRYFFLAYNFPRAEADKFFDYLDKDGSGEVDYDEFVSLVGPFIQPDNLPINASGKREWRNLAKRNASPRKCDIARDFQDVLELIRVKAVQRFSNAREVFNFVDVNYDGTITREEMQQFFGKFNLPEHRANAFFDRLDEDESGAVEYMEFLQHVGPYIELPGIAALMS